MASQEGEREEVSLFRDYLRVRTDHPRPDYVGAVEFVEKFYRERLQVINGGVPIALKVLTLVEGKPIALLSWPAPAPEGKQPSVLLVSHTDVVPCDLDFWDHDPFAASKDSNGDIFARGTQDMKSCGMQHLLSLERLAKLEASSGLKSPRTRNLHVVLVPDEEVGGHDGMELFYKSEEFEALNVGVAMDEGLASESSVYSVFHGERAPWWVNIVARGKAGHGSRFVPDTAPQKLMTVVQRLLDFRSEQFEELQNSIKAATASGSKDGAGSGVHCIVPEKQLGDVTTVNLTALRAGVSADGGKTFQLNCIPCEALAGFDIRIPPTVDLVAFEEQLRHWCEDGLEDVTYEFVQKTTRNEVSDISGEAEWWSVIRSSFEKLGIQYAPRIFPAATDSRYLRLLGIPAYGFSPIINTKVLLHDHNEYLNENVFLAGVDIMESLVQDLVTH